MKLPKGAIDEFIDLCISVSNSCVCILSLVRDLIISLVITHKYNKLFIRRLIQRQTSARVWTPINREPYSTAAGPSFVLLVLRDPNVEHIDCIQKLLSHLCFCTHSTVILHPSVATVIVEYQFCKVWVVFRSPSAICLIVHTPIVGPHVSSYL